MIQKAHVGFGIMGREGNQASSFADYAILRFKDLRRTLFWHGRPFGEKLSKYALWAIFKRTIFGCTVWMYNANNGFSGHQTVDDLIWAMYPVIMANF
jgi:magnesium-transporting ATPase (P-type)